MGMDLAVILIVVLVIVLIWRGPKTLPLLGRAFGQGVKEARKEIEEVKGDSARDRGRGGRDQAPPTLIRRPRLPGDSAARRPSAPATRGACALDAGHDTGPPGHPTSSASSASGSCTG